MQTWAAEGLEAADCRLEKKMKWTMNKWSFLIKLFEKKSL